MVIKIMPGVKVKTRTMVKDVFARALNVFDARIRDIKHMSTQASITMEIVGR